MMRRAFSIAAITLWLVGCTAAPSTSSPSPVIVASGDLVSVYPSALAAVGGLTSHPAAQYSANDHNENSRHYVRVHFSPSFYTIATLSFFTSEHQDGDQSGLATLVLFHPRYRSEGALAHTGPESVTVFDRTVQHHFTPITDTDRIIALTDQLVARDIASIERTPDQPCFDGFVFYVEIKSRNRHELHSFHDCDPGFEEGLLAIAPLIDFAAETFPHMETGIRAYGAGDFGTFVGRQRESALFPITAEEPYETD